MRNKEFSCPLLGEVGQQAVEQRWNKSNKWNEMADKVKTGRCPFEGKCGNIRTGFLSSEFCPAAEMELNFQFGGISHTTLREGDDLVGKAEIEYEKGWEGKRKITIHEGVSYIEDKTKGNR